MTSHFCLIPSTPSETGRYMCITSNIPIENDDTTNVLLRSADSNDLLVIKLPCYQVTVVVYILRLCNRN